MMQTLISNLVTIYENAAKTIGIGKVYKGFNALPDQIPQTSYPYLVLDDGGEHTEASGGQSTQNHFYTVIFEFAVIERTQENSLDAILALSDNIKGVLEASQNRQLDGHTWGITINAFVAADANRNLFRGRTVRVDFRLLEDTYFVY